MSNKTPLVDTLLLLDSYASSHDKASSSLKSAIWNISKARRQKGGHGIGFSYSAHDVREELRAHSRLHSAENHEPILTDDEKNSTGDEIDKVGDDQDKPVFELKYGCAQRRNKKELETPVTKSSSLHDCGVRRRIRGGDSDGVEKNTASNIWSEEDIVNEEEEKLRNADPIELFGAFPPRELKLAQKKAKESLECYIDAANKAVEILRLIQAE